MSDAPRSACRSAWSPVVSSLAAGLLLAIAGGALVAAAGPEDAPTADALRTRRLEVVDDAGQVRAAVFVNAAGPRLMLYDEQGRKRAALAIQGDAPGLELFTPDGTHAMQARLLDEAPRVVLHDRDGRERLLLTLAGEADPQPRASFLAADGRVVAAYPEETTPR